MKRLSKYAALLVGVVLTLNGAKAGTVVFEDDFNVGIDPAKWEREVTGTGSTWIPDNGTITATPNPWNYASRYTDITTIKDDFSDFTMTWSWKFESSSWHKDGRIVYFRCDNTYAPLINGYWLEVMCEYPYNGRASISIGGFDGSQWLNWQVLDLGSGYFSYTDWYTFKLQVCGNEFKVKFWKEGESEPTDWQLTATGDMFASGRIGFGNYWEAVTHVDNVQVESDLPPTADAGANLQIAGTDQSDTVLQGTATDPDNDSLQYRWMEGEVVLLNWTAVGANGEASLALGSLPSFSIGNHTLTLQVKDAISIASDDMVLTIQNSPPEACPAPSSQTVKLGIDPIVVTADVADFDGNTLAYQWLQNSIVLGAGSIATPQGGNRVPIPALSLPAGDPRFGLGVHQIELQVSDGINTPVSAFVSVNVIDTTAPSLSPIPSVTILWPPNHELQPVTIQANASDNGGGAVHLTVEVISSELPDTTGDGETIPDYYIDSVNDQTGLIELRLRSERVGKGSGRTYTVVITATDASGNQSIASVEIKAPHDKGR